MKVNFYKIDVGIAFLILIIDRFFYLVPSSVITNTIGINYSDFSLLCVLVFCGYAFIKYGLYMRPKDYKFLIAFSFIFILSIIGAIIPDRLFGQSFLKGLLAQRVFFIIPIIYITFRRLLSRGLTTWERINNIVFWIAVIEMLLCSIQMLLSNQVSFLSLTVSYHGMISESSTRFNMQSPWIIVVLTESLSALTSDKPNNHRIGYILSLILFFYYIIVVVQSRMAIVGYIAILVVFIFINRTSLSKKMMLFIMGSAILCAVLVSPVGQYMIETILNQSSDLSASIRVEGRAYYLTKLSDHLFFGYGFPHETSTAAYSTAGIFNGIYAIDNGIFGFFYMYGLLGLAWMLYLYFKLMINGISAQKNTNNIFFLLYAIYLLATCLSLYTWYWFISNAFMFAIVYASIEEYITSNSNIDCCDSYSITDYVN